MYGSNKSYSKLLVVGLSDLETDNFEYQPVVYLCSPDFSGFKFDFENWEILKTKFGSIENYFTSQSKSDEGIIISSGGFKIKFGRSYEEKSIIIYKDNTQEEDDEPPLKKVRGEK